MSDGQLAAILTALGGFLVGGAGLVRWMFGVWMSEKKDERIDRKDERREDRAAITAVATAMTTIALRFDSMEKKLDGMAEDFDEVSGVHEAAPRQFHRPVSEPSTGVPRQRRGGG